MREASWRWLGSWADALGYSPLPINLVQADVDQVGQIPGSTHKLSGTDLQNCNNQHTLTHPDLPDHLVARKSAI